MNRFIKLMVLSASIWCMNFASAGIINLYNLDFDSSTLKSYDQGDQNQGDYSTWDLNGSTVLSLHENSWYTFNLLDNLGLSSIDLDDRLTQWVVSFDFFVKDPNKTGLLPEIAGLMFADFSGGQTKPQENRTFNLYGTQDYGLDDFSWTGSGWWVSYSFTLDDFISGRVTDLIFINDCDGEVASADCGGTNARFKDVTLAEVSEPTAVSIALLGLGIMGWRARRQ